MTSSSSLVRYRIIGTSTSGFTWNGKRLALKLSRGLEENNVDLIREMAEEYGILMKKSGSETNIRLFCGSARCFL